MGLFDQLAGQVLGSLNSGSNQGGDNPLLQIASTLLQGQGGLAGLLEKFQQAGLGEHAASWVGTGANLPVDGSQITQALGSDTLSALARKFGLSGTQVSAGLAQELPQLIDKVTPNGNTEGASDLLQQGLSVLSGFLNKA